MTHTKCR